MSLSSTSKSDSVPLSAGFQRRMVSGILSGDARLLPCVSVLEPAHLSAAGLPTIWEGVKHLYQEHGELPSWKLTKEQVYKTVKDKDERNYYYRILRKCRSSIKSSEVSYILKHVHDFVAIQKLASAYRDTLPLFERGDLSGIKTTLSKALNEEKGSTADVDYFAQVQERLRNRRKVPTKVIRTLISPLDAVLRNRGLRRGETGVVLAASGTGKTRFLVHCAKAAAVQRQKVVYYTLQLPTDDIAEILDATFSGVPQFDLIEEEQTVFHKVTRFGKQHGNCIILKYWPRYQATIKMIEEHLLQLMAKGWKPDVVVIDFLNYLLSNGKNQSSDQRYFELQAVVAEWIALVQKLNIVSWGGFQARRGARDEELTTLEDIAESYGAAMEATLVVSINRTPDEKKMEQARLFMAKYTHGADGQVIPVMTNYRKGAFYKGTQSVRAA